MKITSYDENFKSHSRRLVVKRQRYWIKFQILTLKDKTYYSISK